MVGTYTLSQSMTLLSTVTTEISIANYYFCLMQLIFCIWVIIMQHTQIQDNWKPACMCYDDMYYNIFLVLIVVLTIGFQCTLS